MAKLSLLVWNHDNLPYYSFKHLNLIRESTFECESMIYSLGLNTEMYFDFRLSFIILPITVDQTNFVSEFPSWRSG